MMIQIDHRESHDVDLFLADAQFLSYLNPDTQDLPFSRPFDAYKSDGSRFIKFVFEDLGEIDFIATNSLTTNPTVKKRVEGVEVHLERVPEIIAKKVFFRGKSIKPRDIFDISAACNDYEQEIVEELSAYPDAVHETLQTLGRLNPEFVKKAISDLMIRKSFSHLVETALEDTRRLLEAVSPVDGK